MSQPGKTEFTIYVIEAKGRAKDWYVVADWAVPGYKRWRDHEHRVSGTHGDRSYSDCLAFSTADTALQALWYARTDSLHPHPYGRDYGDRVTGLIDRGIYRAIEKRVIIETREIADESALESSEARA